MQFLIFLTLFCAACAANFRNCDPKSSGEVLKAGLNDCNTEQEVCILKKGQKYQINIQFKPKVPLERVRASVRAVVAGLEVPYPLPNSDVCKSGVLQCPVKENEVQSYQNEMKMLSWYPSIPVVVKYSLKDGNGASVVCVEFSGKVE